jgi:hypothetical protein
MRKRKLFRCGSFSLIDLVAYLTMVREYELTISCNSHDNRAKIERITEKLRGPHPSRIAKALGIPNIAAFGNLQLVAE